MKNLIICGLCALCLIAPSLAQAQENAPLHENWAYQAIPTSPGFTGQDIAGTADIRVQAHDQKSAFPPLAVALKAAQVQVYSPEEAIGKGSFYRSENGIIHGNSGLECPNGHAINEEQNDAATYKLFLFRVMTYAADGSDVSCAYVTENKQFLMTVFASQWPERTLEDHFNIAANIMVTRETPFGAQVPMILVNLDSDSFENISETTMAVAYDSPPNADGVIIREGLWLNKTRNWHIKVRATHTPPADEPLFLAMLAHLTALLNASEDDSTMSNQLISYSRSTTDISKWGWINE